MAQIPKGSQVKGQYKPICRDRAMYFSSTVQAITYRCFHAGIKNRHVLADVSNAEASDVAHAATLLDPWLQNSRKKLADPTF